MRGLSELYDVSANESDEARRRRLLNSMLLVLASGCLLLLLALLLMSSPGGAAGPPSEDLLLYIGIGIALVGSAAIYALNRYVSGTVASALFVALLIAIATFLDQPEEVVNGRSLLVFAIPIVSASMLLRPWASLAAAGLSSAAILALSLFVLRETPNVVATLGFFVLGLLAYLATRSLEQASIELRDGNRALWESEGRYRMLVETMSDGLTIIDRAAAITYANARFCEMVGRTPAEVMGRPMSELLDEHNRQILSEQLLKRQAGEYAPYELSYSRSDGYQVHTIVSPRPILDHEGHYVGASGVITDITERRWAEALLAEAHARLQHVLDASPAVIYTCRVDPDGKSEDGWAPTFVSGKIRDLFGYEVRECLGDPRWWSEHLHPEDRVKAIAESTRVLERGAIAHDYRFRHADGEYTWVRDHLVLVRDAAGRPEFMIMPFSTTKRQPAFSKLYQDRPTRA